MLYSGLALADWRISFQPQHTPVGQQVNDLHAIVLWICVVIFIGVFGAMLYAMFKHRKSIGHKAEQFHENTTVEIAWTVIPFIILIAMAFPATKALLNMRDAAAPDLTVKVTAYQWKWQYEYLQDGVSFFSNLSTPLDQIEGRAPKGEHYLLEVDRPLVVPVGKKVRVLTTAGDVIHAWYVPSLAVKQDAIPGFVRDAWFRVDSPGTYRGQCAELCGKDHGFMPIVVEARSEDEFKKWIAEQKSAAAAAAKSQSSSATPPAGEQVQVARR